jgi:hypothetical protein
MSDNLRKWASVNNHSIPQVLLEYLEVEKKKAEEVTFNNADLSIIRFAQGKRHALNELLTILKPSPSNR